MGYAFHAGAAVAVASGAVLVALGIALLRLRPRSRATVGFGTLGLLWGVQVVAANISRMATDTATAEPWVYAFVALAIPLYVPLAVGLSTFPLRGGRRVGPATLAALSLPAFVLLMLLGAFPELFVEGVVENDAGVLVTRGGPLFVPVALVDSILVFALTLGFSLVALRHADRDTTRYQLSLTTAGLTAYVAYRGADVTWVGVRSGAALFEGLGVFTGSLLWGTGIACLVAAGAAGLTFLRDKDLPWRDVGLLATFVPPIFALAEGFLESAGLFGFDTVGLWRIVLAVLVAYAVARYRLFDLELRLGNVAPVAAYLGVSLAGLGLLWGFMGDPLSRAPVLGVTASLGVVAILVPAMGLTRRSLSGVLGRAYEPDHIYRRKLDVYRAAVEEARASGLAVDDDDPFIDSLRRDLGISASEHRVLLMMLEEQRRTGPPERAPDADRFDVIEELGRGSFARALLARDGVLDRNVVLKQANTGWLVTDAGKRAFLREARMAARISHPNVVVIHEVLPDADPPTLVLEYVAGGSLEDRIEADGHLPVDAAVGVVIDVLRGLGAVHDAGIVHRDVKPANILIQGDGTAKITDFGIARPPPEFERTATTLDPRVQPGSLAFMSPEQATQDANGLDGRSDLYSVGVVLYRAVTGEHYLDLRGITADEARSRIAQIPPALPHTRIPEALDAVLRKALAKERTSRFASADEMAEALEALAAELAD